MMSRFIRLLLLPAAALLAACSTLPAGSRAVPPPASLMGQWVHENTYDTIELPNSPDREMPMDLGSLMDDIRHDLAGTVNPRAEFDPAAVTFTAAGSSSRTRYRTYIMPDGRYLLRGVSKTDAIYDPRTRRILMPRGIDAGQLQVPLTLRPAQDRP